MLRHLEQRNRRECNRYCERVARVDVRHERGDRDHVRNEHPQHAEERVVEAIFNDARKLLVACDESAVNPLVLPSEKFDELGLGYKLVECRHAGIGGGHELFGDLDTALGQPVVDRNDEDEGREAGESRPTKKPA